MRPGCTPFFVGLHSPEDFAMTTKDNVIYWLNAAITTLNNFKSIIPGKCDDLAWVLTAYPAIDAYSTLTLSSGQNYIKSLSENPSTPPLASPRHDLKLLAG
jgi:hypothetical protein